MMSGAGRILGSGEFVPSVTNTLNSESDQRSASTSNSSAIQADQPLPTETVQSNHNPRVSAITTTTTSTKGVGDSFVYSHNTTTATTKRASDVIDLTGDIEESMAKIENLHAKISEIHKFLPDLSYTACEDMLRACGSVKEVLSIMFGNNVPSDANIKNENPDTPELTPPDDVTRIGHNGDDRRSRSGSFSKAKYTTEEKEHFEDEVKKLNELRPRSKMNKCRKAIRVCDGDSEQAFSLLESGFDFDSSPEGRSIRSMQAPASPPESPTISITNAEQPSPSESNMHDKTRVLRFFADHTGIGSQIEDENTDSKTEESSDGGEDSQDEKSGSKVDTLWEVLHGKVTRDEINKALIFQKGNAEKALNDLISGAHSGNEDVLFFKPRRRLLSRGAMMTLKQESKKRKSKSPDNRSSKQQKHSEDEMFGDDELDSFGDDDEVAGKQLTPAGEWLNKMYPESTNVVLFLGADQIPRNNIPSKVLLENFGFLRSAIHSAASSRAGPSTTKCYISGVSPEAFDLSAQLMIRGDISLPSGPNETKISAILELIQALVWLEAVHFRQSVVKMEKKLKSVLTCDRLALTSNHIRTADRLGEDGESIVDMFALATVRLVMQKESDQESPFEDDDEEGMNPAQRMHYSGSYFALNREMKRIPRFGSKVKDEVLRCLSDRFRSIKRRRKGCHAEISVPVFTDPLDGMTFEL